MKTLFMMMGLPASGKSTKAIQMLADIGHGNVKRVSKDSIRDMIDGGKWSKDNEKFVLTVRDFIVRAALQAGKHVIVDDTNLAPKHQEQLRAIAKECGALFEIADFRHVPLEECIARDRKRANYVGEQVIRSMWKQFLAPKIEPVPDVYGLPACVIVDLDGTLCRMNGRGPFEWERVGEDLENEAVVSLVRMVETGKVIFVSGRDECCREQSLVWLQDRGLIAGEPLLFMRPAGDMRDDRIIKREIYEREIQGKYNVRFILDDRNKVVEQWRQMGLPCFQVADGDF